MGILKIPLSNYGKCGLLLVMPVFYSFAVCLELRYQVLYLFIGQFHYCWWCKKNYYTAFHIGVLSYILLLSCLIYMYIL